MNFLRFTLQVKFLVLGSGWILWFIKFNKVGSEGLLPTFVLLRVLSRSRPSRYLYQVAAFSSTLAAQNTSLITAIFRHDWLAPLTGYLCLPSKVRVPFLWGYYHSPPNCQYSLLGLLSSGLPRSDTIVRIRHEFSLLCEIRDNSYCPSDWQGFNVPDIILSQTQGCSRGIILNWIQSRIFHQDLGPSTTNIAVTTLLRTPEHSAEGEQ